MADTIAYDIAYYDKMLRQYSSSAQAICEIRWNWILNSIGPSTVLDYGSGIGWFRAFAPLGTDVDTLDVMPTVQTGVTRDRYDLLTLWDVLEHLPGLEPIEDFLRTSKYVAVSIPILPEGQSWKGWKHWKPHEHLIYPSQGQVVALFESYGYQEIKRGQPECPPRVDVWNFLFQKQDIPKP